MNNDSYSARPLVVLDLPNLYFAFQFNENRQPRERGPSGQ
jgi:hypothetical protein